MNPFKNVLAYYRILKNANEKIRRISGKDRMLDLFFSRLLLKIRYDDYINLGFYYKSWRNRKQYIIDDVTPAIKYNSFKAKELNEDKGALLNKIRPYVHRKIISTDNLSFTQFTEFVNSASSFFYKPNNGCGGQGVKKITLSEDISIHDLYNNIKMLPQGLLEETVIQHPEMNKLCPTLVQTIRFCVFKHINGPRILFATLRTSRISNSYVDNAAAGGIFANIDLSTGRIRTNAFCELYIQADIDQIDPRLFTDEGLISHPITGTTFKEFHIPHFQEAKQLVIDVTKNVDFNGRRLLGFDVAISRTGPELIEVNTDRPDIVGLWQVACKSEPLRETMKSILEE